MSNFFLVRSKKNINKKIFNKMLFNLNNKYLNLSENLISFRSKNYYYFIGLKAEKLNKIIKIDNDLVMIMTGSIFNLKDNSIDHIFSEYLRHGLRFLKKLDGNFSIVVLDVKKDKITAIRDRHGSNLLFFNKNKKFFTIFTKIRLLKDISIYKLRPNRELINTYLFKNYRYSYGSESTFFSNLFLFKNNSINFIDKFSFKTEKLYSFKFVYKNYYNQIKAKKKFLYLLKNSFKKRYTDEKSSAFLLSGGLDSPTVASIASKNIANKIKTYSIGYKIRKKKNELFYDETKLIKKISKFNNFKSKIIYPSDKNFLKIFNEMLNIHDEPISSPTWYSHFLLCKFLYKNKIKYVFGGDGGDHILAGLYDDIPYFLADLKFSNNFKKFKYELKKWIQLHDHPIFKKNEKIFKTYLKKCFDKKKKGYIKNYTWDESQMRNDNQYLKIIQKKIKFEKFNKFPSITKSFLKSKLVQDLHHSSSPPSTRAEIPNFSNFGLECRSVFLDEKVVNFCWDLPNNLMIKDGYTKWLIRYALKDFLPKEVLWNKKHIGLNAPANIWFRRKLKTDLKKTVNNLTKRKKFKFINKKLLKKIFKDHFDEKNDHMMFLWKFYSLEKWLVNWKFK